MKNVAFVSAIALFFILCLSGCNGILPNTKAYYDSLIASRRAANEMTSFYLQRPDGTTFVECKINANTNAITADILPVDAPQLVSLNAIFSLTGGMVTVNGVPQVSGVTLNDFTLPVSYAVTAYDNTIRTYVVTLRTLSSEKYTITISTPDYSEHDMQLVHTITGTTITFTAKSDYDSYTWYVDAEPLAGKTTNTCSLDISGYDAGKYTLMLLVGSGADRYSATCQFTVQR